MDLNADIVRSLVEAELDRCHDIRVTDAIRARLVEPYVELRIWDYGPERFLPCWIVARDPDVRTILAYCDQGFGPRMPWGMLWMHDPSLSLEDQPPHMSMGQDCSWYSSLIEVFLESWMATRLPIWRIFRNRDPHMRPLTPEMSHDEASSVAKRMNEEDPASNYFSHHCIEIDTSPDR